MENTKRPLILVSNDDGINSKGIKVLTDIARNFGDVLVVAPRFPQSAMACALTIRNALNYDLIHKEPGLVIYDCNGTPVDCVKFALTQLIQGKPDLILSGINHGINTAVNVVYSGTMGIVLEGCVHNIPALGFSIDSHEEVIDFSAVKSIGMTIVKRIIENKLAEYVGLNINFPNIPESEIKGIRICHQTKGYWWDNYEEVNSEEEKSYLLKGEFINQEPDNEETDVWALRNNYVAIVPVKADFTDYSAIKQLKSMNF